MTPPSTNALSRAGAASSHPAPNTPSSSSAHPLEEAAQAFVNAFKDSAAENLAALAPLRQALSQHAGTLLNALPPEQNFVSVGDDIFHRSDIEAIAVGRAYPPTSEERAFLQETFQALAQTDVDMRQGWQANVHLGGFLATGHLALEKFKRLNTAPPLSIEHARAQIEQQFRGHADVLDGLAHAQSQTQPVSEGRLHTHVEEVICQVWTYCQRHSDDTRRENLINAFAERLRNIHAEKPCPLGVVQRLLQVPEGVDSAFDSALPNAQAVEEEITSLVAKLDEFIDSHRKLPGAFEDALMAKVALAKQAIAHSLVTLRGLPQALVDKASDKPLLSIEQNELYVADKTLGSLRPEYRDHAGASPLHKACRTGNTAAILEQIQRGADANQVDQNGRTALIWAVFRGKTEPVAALLNAEGINVNQANQFGITALIYAASTGKTEIVQALLNVKGIKVNQAMHNGKTALMLATDKGHKDIVQALLNVKGIEVNQADRLNGETTLMWAAGRGYTDIVQALLKVEGIKVNQTNEHNGETALMQAVEGGHTDIVQALLNVKGIEVNQTDGLNEESALMRAAVRGHTDIVQALLKVEGIKVNQADRRNGGETALIRAAKNGHTDIVYALLKVEGIELNRLSQDTRPLFSLMSKIDHIEKVQNQGEARGRTALMWAAENGHAETVYALLKIDGINVNQADQLGMTALMWANANGHADTFYALRKAAGVNVN